MFLKVVYLEGIYLIEYTVKSV